MNPNIHQLINNYAQEHTQLQLGCYQMSSIANDLGYPGASKWFLIQAQDEVLHTRKIYNYLLGRDEKLIINQAKAANIKASTLLELFEIYKKTKIEFINNTILLINASKEANDYLTIKFLDWFLIDFYEEIAQANDYIDMIKMSNNDLYSFDKRLSKRLEPDTLKVIVPY